METKLISVIIPVYNVEKYLRQCLDSVLHQTYTDYEVIMVDDGSTDSSFVICDEYSGNDQRFRVIRQENQGLSSARNAGYEASKGGYVYFMDSDDWIEITTLEKLIQKAVDSNADFVFFDGKSFEDSPKGYDIKQGYTRNHEYPVGIGIDIFDALQKNKDFKSAVPTYFWKRSFLEANRMRFYPGIYYEDMIFAFEAFCRAHSVAHCHEAFYHRRVRANSIMTSKPDAKRFLSWCTVYDEVKRIAEENAVVDTPSCRSYLVRIAMRVMDVYDRLSAADKKPYADDIRRIRSEIRKTGGFSNKALIARTYGKLPWVFYRAFQKMTRTDCGKNRCHSEEEQRSDVGIP